MHPRMVTMFFTWDQRITVLDSHVKEGLSFSFAIRPVINLIFLLADYLFEKKEKGVMKR